MRVAEVFKRFEKESPISVMARTTLEHVLDSDRLDRLFEEYAVQQKCGDLAFSDGCRPDGTGSNQSKAVSQCCVQAPNKRTSRCVNRLDLQQTAGYRACSRAGDGCRDCAGSTDGTRIAQERLACFICERLQDSDHRWQSLRRHATSDRRTSHLGGRGAAWSMHPHSRPRPSFDTRCNSLAKTVMLRNAPCFPRSLSWSSPVNYGLETESLAPRP